MEMTPGILVGNVMHKRLFPKINAFTYGIYYLVLPLSELSRVPIAIDRFSPLSFHTCDHGPKNGEDLDAWIKSLLRSNMVNKDLEVLLVAMPRVLGYVFNPVSFWLCMDRDKNLCAVLCEVRNTFGETHLYLCAHDNQEPIASDEWLTGDKFFHVSPFLRREGCYRFRFNVRGDSLGIWIDYEADDGRKQLLTALTGKIKPMTKSALRHVFWRYPLITLKTILLIHWQALKLCLKGIKYIPKPRQMEQSLTKNSNVTKM